MQISYNTDSVGSETQLLTTHFRQFRTHYYIIEYLIGQGLNFHDN